MDQTEEWILTRLAGRPRTYPEWLAEMRRWLPRHAAQSPAQRMAERLLVLQVSLRFPGEN